VTYIFQKYSHDESKNINLMILSSMDVYTSMEKDGNKQLGNMWFISLYILKVFFMVNLKT
jgi:uncharacterized sporulation protein YeaH/YhbH (DUF444 family)